MKKSFIMFAILTSLLIAVPTYARESHAGRPSDLGGSVSVNSRESHAGLPSDPGVSISGSVGSMGSGSYLGGGASFGGPSSGSSSSFGGGSYFGGGYWPIFTPVQRSFQWFFSILFNPIGLF